MYKHMKSSSYFVKRDLALDKPTENSPYADKSDVEDSH